MAYSSITTSSSIFFALITGFENQFDDIILYLVIYILSIFIILNLITLYYNLSFLRNLSINYNFPKSNIIMFFFNSNKYYIFIFLLTILLVNSFPPFVSFGIKLLVSIDFILNNSNLFVYIFLLFNLIGFLFYINLIIGFFNGSKTYKNKFFYENVYTAWLIFFCILGLVVTTFIFNLEY